MSIVVGHPVYSIGPIVNKLIVLNYFGQPCRNKYSIIKIVLSNHHRHVGPFFGPYCTNLLCNKLKHFGLSFFFSSLKIDHLENIIIISKLSVYFYVLCGTY